MNLTRISIGVATVAVLAVVALGWFFGIGPRLTETQRLDDERTAVEAQNQVQEASLTALAAEFARRDEVLAELATARELVPTSPEVVAFLSELTAIAATTGVSLDNYTVSEAVSYTGTVEAAPVAAAPTTDTGAGTGAPSTTTPVSGAAVIPDASALGLYYVPLTITVTGGPDQIVQFIGAVQEGPRLFIAPSVTLSGPEGGGTPAATLTGFVFALPESASSTAAAATTASGVSPATPAAPAG